MSMSMASSSSSQEKGAGQPGLSLRMVPGPAAGASSSVSMATTAHPEHAGVHDAMRHGARNLAFETSSAEKHPLQARLESWDQTRDTLKLTLQRNMYGMGVPVRSAFERQALQWDPHFPTLHQFPGNGIGGSTRGGFCQFQRDILDGNDESIGPKDFLPTPAISGPQVDIHAVMEQKYGI
ncbi:unnamed protein product [Parajaminaea phylloscopi]